MESGDKIYIRNNAGKLIVELVEKMSLCDVSRGIGDDKLPEMKQPRWEFHKGRYGEHLITLCDAKGELPGTMYVAVWDSFEDPEIWEGRFDNAEEDENVFETIGI